MEPDILLNIFPLTLALFYRLKVEETVKQSDEAALINVEVAKTRANWYIFLASSPFIIPELDQFPWLHDGIVWAGTAAWLLLAKGLIWVAAPKVAKTISQPWLGKWQIRILGALFLIGYARENLF